MNRYRADEATIWVWDDYDRTCLKWRSSDFWDEIRVSLKDYFPRHGDLSYSPSRKLWSVPAWHRSELEEWLCWTFEPEAVHCGEEPPSAHERWRNYSSSRFSGRGRVGSSTTSSIEAAYARLHLLPTAPPEVAQAAHRAMVRLTHPDCGGSVEAATLVNLAWELIGADLAQKRRAS